MKRLLLVFAVAVSVSAALAGFRVDSEPIPSNGAMNGTNCVASKAVQFPNGAELKEVQFYGFSGGTTVTVSRVSSDLATTGTVTSVISTGGTNAIVTLNSVETVRYFRMLDTFFASASQTGVTFKVRPVFIAYEP